MITRLTQAAIAVLSDIRAGGKCCHTGSNDLSGDERLYLFNKLEAAGLIHLRDSEAPLEPSSYALVKNVRDISLLDILEATDEHLNCNHPTSENFYAHYGEAGRKLGVVNYMTRLYLQGIKLLEL